jgi:hypothetical protein
MAEPWVPKAELTAADATMDDLEVFITPAQVYTDLIATNVALALTNRNTINAIAQQQFNPLFLGG